MRIRRESRPRSRSGGALLDLLKLCLIVGAAMGLNWLLIHRNARAPEKLYVQDARFDLVSLDAGKEQYAVREGAAYGESLPGGVDYMLENGLLNDPLRLEGTGEFAINPLATDPAFRPARPMPDPPFPIALPVAFSELPSNVDGEFAGEGEAASETPAPAAEADKKAPAAAKTAKAPEPAPAEEPAPADEAAAAEKSAPAEEAASVEPVPAEGPAPADEAAAEQPAPAAEAATAENEESASAEESAEPEPMPEPEAAAGAPETPAAESEPLEETEQ